MMPPVAHSFKVRDRKLKKLGLSYYKEYLESNLWRNLKAEVYDRTGCCEGCGTKDNLQVHHASYTFMHTHTYPKGKAKSLRLVCNECHEGIHDLAKNENIGLVEATKIYLMIAQRDIPSKESLNRLGTTSVRGKGTDQPKRSTQ